VREEQLWEIFQKTGGHCHHCGDRLRFDNRGWSANPRGHWELDQVIQRKKGGDTGTENYLPACTECNRLRWARTGPALRRLVRLGLIATEEIERGSPVGLHLQAMLRRLLENETRRLEKYLAGNRWELYWNRHAQNSRGRRGGRTSRRRALVAVLDEPAMEPRNSRSERFGQNRFRVGRTHRSSVSCADGCSANTVASPRSGARNSPLEHRPHFADSLQLAGETSRLPRAGLGYEVVCLAGFA